VLFAHVINKYYSLDVDDPSRLLLAVVGNFRLRFVLLFRLDIVLISRCLGIEINPSRDCHPLLAVVGNFRLGCVLLFRLDLVLILLAVVGNFRGI